MKTVLKVMAAGVLCAVFGRNMYADNQPVKAVKQVETDKEWTIQIINPDRPNQIISSAVFKKDTRFFPGMGKGLYFDFGPFGTDINVIYVYKDKYLGEVALPNFIQNKALLFSKEVQGPKGEHKTTDGGWVEKILPGGQLKVHGNAVWVANPKKDTSKKEPLFIVVKGKNMPSDVPIIIQFNAAGDSLNVTTIKKTLSNKPIVLKLHDPKIKGKNIVEFSVRTSEKYDNPMKWRLEIVDPEKDQRIEVYDNGERLRFNDNPDVEFVTRPALGGSFERIKEARKKEAAYKQRRIDQLTNKEVLAKREYLKADAALLRAKNGELDRNLDSEALRFVLVAMQKELLEKEPSLADDMKTVREASGVIPTGTFVRIKQHIGLFQPKLIEWRERELGEKERAATAITRELIKVEGKQEEPFAIHLPEKFGVVSED